MRISPLRQGMSRHLVAGLLAAGCSAALPVASAVAQPAREAAGTPAISFTRDIAPIVYAHCTACHRPGEVGPFSLISYNDVRQHARQIVEVTRRRVMPPWKPLPGKGEFLDARALSDAQIAAFDRWLAAGVPEGDPRDLPPAPTFATGWQFGTPDLVITMPVPYVLRADGPDVFRTMVLPIPTDRVRYVKAIEFHPGNARAVHHANIGVDRTRASRRLDEQDAEPGHDGSMAQAASYPPGYMLGWTPGQRPRPSPDGMAWRLERDSDLVAGLHLQTTGKPEPVQISVGFYFTDEAPTRAPVGLRLGSQTMDIAPGQPAYTITDSYTLPVDADVIAIQPHAHNLGRTMAAQATRPDGSIVPLIAIDDWDFRWQDVYRYATPIRLPRGSVIAMRYVYDNSAANVRNPFHPPQRVVWGQNTNDEMGDLWIQMVPRDGQQFTQLSNDVAAKMRAEDLKAYSGLLAKEGDKAFRHEAVALLYLQGGDADQAVSHFREAIRLDATVAATHYNLGLALAAQRKYDDAISAFRKASQVDPQHADAENNLGALLHATGRVDEAVPHYRRALALKPENAEAHDNLGRILSARGERREAVSHFRTAMQLRPDWASPMSGLAWLYATAPASRKEEIAEAVQLAEQASRLTGQGDPAVLDALAAAYAAGGQFDRAVVTAKAALQLATRTRLTAFAAEIQGRLSLYEGRRAFRVE